jgi:serine/threonine-protein phosphatase Stp1
MFKLFDRLKPPHETYHSGPTDASGMRRTQAAVPTGTPVLTAEARTNVGMVRKVNEDSVLSAPEIAIWAVADGVGGHQAGDFASQTLMAKLHDLPAAQPVDDKVAGIRKVIEDHHEYLRDVASERGGDTIATTIVALTIDGWHYHCQWAGDSRLYLRRDGTLTRISHDHSYVQDLVDQGLWKAEEAESHPRANVITSAVGAGDKIRIDKRDGGVMPGDIFLICTDGLTRMVPEAKINQTLAGQSLGAVADELIALALAAGGRDNVSVVLVRCAEAS